MISTFDYNDNCWWCGNKADSGEHKYKKADLIREFGRGPYKGNDAIVRVLLGKQRNIPGPNSKEVKFENNLCQPCNNARSQPFDREYDTFTEYIRQNEYVICTAKQFKFSEIFGSNWKDNRENLVKYFVKHICCSLAIAKVLIKPPLIDYLNGTSDLEYLSLHLEIREDIVALVKNYKAKGKEIGNLWIGKMSCMLSPSTGAISEVTSFLGYRWLRLNYTYDESISPARDNFSSDKVTLDSNYNEDPNSILKM